MRFKVEQIKRELGTLTFSRVLKVVNDASNSHFYGFADEEEGKRIYFQKDGEKEGIHVGPAFVRSTVRSSSVRSAMLEKGTVMVGVVEIVDKGPRYKWWIAGVGASALRHFQKHLHRGFAPKKNSTVLYQQLALPCGGDDLWALFLLLTGGNVADFVAEKTGKNLLRHPTKRVSKYQHKRGLDLQRPVEEFVFLATRFCRDEEVFCQFRTLCDKKSVTDIVWERFLEGVQLTFF